MIINKITLKNFQLFSNQIIDLDKINLITGINYDSLEENGIFSSNGSGKSTILNAILFGLFGEVTDINLKDLISFGAKEAEVSIVLSHNNKNIIISRKIPSALSISVDGKEIQFNTATLAQKYLNELFGADFLHYRTYNLIDNKKGINLLDLGITSLRKALMDFVNEQFIGIRQSLLAKKLDRETYNKDKRLYTFSLSEKRLAILNAGLDEIKADYLKFARDRDAQAGITNQLQGEIESRKKLIYFREKDKNFLKVGECPILKIKCQKLTDQLIPIEKTKEAEIQVIREEMKQYQDQLKSELEVLAYYNAILEQKEDEERKARECLLKLKEAQKFAAYKYTKEDVQLYADSIKILDSFSSYYIMEWLSNLEIIINDLLKGLNLAVEFNAEKDFIKIINNGEELNYSQLSSGQKKFLGTVFKIGILLQEGIDSGLLLFDEGLGDIDQINFYKLIDILKELNFQCVIIYQNVDKSIQDVNYINAERKDGVTIIK